MVHSSPPLPLQHKTIFFDLALQMYMFQEIKQPVMQGVEVLFDPKAPKFKKLRAVKLLWDAFNALKGLPEPTKENTWHPNSHNLIELRDWLFERINLGALRTNFIRRVMNFIIILYDFDPPWRWILDNVKDEALKKNWKPRGFDDTWLDTYVWWKDKPAL